jgi:hypothetical protein
MERDFQRRRFVRHRIFCLASCLVFLGATVLAGEVQQDRQYDIVGAYETDYQGNVLNQTSASGYLLIKADGTYELKSNDTVQGTWMFIPAGTGNAAIDMFQFRTTDGYQHFAYANGTQLAIWLSQTQTGTHIWLNSTLSITGTAETPQTEQQQGTGQSAGQPFSIVNGVFDRTVMYADSSANSYLRYYEDTGDFDADTRGIILRADGSYYLRVELGEVVHVERGRYMVSGNQVIVQFSDGSAMNLAMEDNGRRLVMYSGGMLISEYFYLGSPNR